MSEEKKQSSIQTLHAQMQDVEVALFTFTGATGPKDRKKAGKEFRKTMKFLKRGISAAYQESLDIEKGKKPPEAAVADTADGAKVCLASEPAEGPQGEPAVLVELEVIETAISTVAPELAASAPAEVAVEAEPVAAWPEPESVQELVIEPATVEAEPTPDNTTIPVADVSIEATAPVAEPATDLAPASPAEGGEAA